jgi:hypothetical protein
VAKQVGMAHFILYEELKRGTVGQMRNNLTYDERYFAKTGELACMKHHIRSVFSGADCSTFIYHIIFLSDCPI